ncbi:MAG: hypothetical protein WCI88_13455 [Chloroflexota bacterium]
MLSDHHKISTDMNEYDQNLNTQEFADLFGVPIEDLSDECNQLIAHGDFRYRMVHEEERDQIILDVLKRVDSGTLTKAGKEGKPRWEAGWGENFNNFVAHNHDVSQLIPRYIHAGKPLRLYQDFIYSKDPLFEIRWYEVFQLWLFQTYLKDVENIYEFACGPCHNLVTLAHLYPQKNIFGLDWAEPSVKIANLLGSVYGWKVKGMPFDFFNPDKEVKILENSAVMTIGGLEQTGTNHVNFIEFIMQQRPKLVIHVEPLLEWYDEMNLVDYLAIRFHKTRKYLEGLIPYLMDAAQQGRIEIIKENRCYFGSLYHDGYSLLVWRPR